jgi:pyrimidine-nucleoside phosphorylase
MIHLGGKAGTPEQGTELAEHALTDNSALNAFLKMIELQGGDLSVFHNLKASHKPAATKILAAWESGYIVEMDTTAIGWAVQRTGAGREKACEPVDAHAGIEFHAKRGAHIEKGQPIATLYGTSHAHLEEAITLLRSAIQISREQSSTPPPPLVSRIFTAENAKEYLAEFAKVIQKQGTGNKA